MLEITFSSETGRSNRDIKKKHLHSKQILSVLPWALLRLRTTSVSSRNPFWLTPSVTVDN